MNSYRIDGDITYLLFKDNICGIIDTNDLPMIERLHWTLYLKKTCSYLRNSKTKQKLHRYILGVADSRIFIDHIDHNGLNNRRGNLRACSNQQNCMNRRPLNATSQFKGVAWKNKNKKWVSTININAKQIHLGYFDNEIQAALTYNKMASKLFGEFAYLNEIPNVLSVS